MNCWLPKKVSVPWSLCVCVCVCGGGDVQNQCLSGRTVTFTILVIIFINSTDEQVSLLKKNTLLKSGEAYKTWSYSFHSQFQIYSAPCFWTPSVCILSPVNVTHLRLPLVERASAATSSKKKKKSKSVPLQARSGPEGSRKLRFPDFMTTAQGGGTVVSLTHWPHLPPGKSPGAHFC